MLFIGETKMYKELVLSQDQEAKEYINLNKDVYAMFIWPRIGNDQNARYIEESLKEDGFEILYKKKMKLTRDQFWNLVFNAYKEEFWIWTPFDGFKGVDENVSRTYRENGYLYVYVLDNLDVVKLIEKKESLRKHFAVGNNSMHNFDTSNESIEILNILLSKDYHKVLGENFLKTKDSNYSTFKYVKRKIKYTYVRLLNKFKYIMGKDL